MKINGKKIGEWLTFAFKGKTMSYHNSDSTKVDELMNKIKSFNESGDENIIEEIETLLNSKKVENAKQIEQIEETKKQVEVELEDEIEKTKDIAKDVEIIAQKIDATKADGLNDDFIKTGDKYYMKGYENVEMPSPLVDAFAKLIIKGEDYEFLKNFWLLCLLNPNPRARFDLFKYLHKQGLIITNRGYFLTFRRVVQTDNKVKNVDLNFNKQMVELHTKIKKVWRRNPKNYEVITKENEFTAVETQKLNGRVSLGNLDELFIKASNLETFVDGEIFTDAHTKTMQIQIGIPVRMDREKCDNNHNRECSYGLHVGTPYYVKSNSSLGSQLVACLINPAHVVSVPYNDAHKMRVCEYLPLYKMSKDSEIDTITKDLILIKKFDNDYFELEKEELLEKLQTLNLSSFSENEVFEKKSFEIESLKDVEKMKKYLQEIEEKLANAKQEKFKINYDSVNPDLNNVQISEIIKSRIQKGN